MPDSEMFLDPIQILWPGPYITMPAVNKHKHRQLHTSLIPDHNRNAQGGLDLRNLSKEAPVAFWLQKVATKHIVEVEVDFPLRAVCEQRECPLIAEIGEVAHTGVW